MFAGAGLRLHVVGEGAGPPVILLHGFPEFWYSWRHQISSLAAAGFSVLAPDMRGFNLSDRPLKVADYRIDRLVADVEALVRASGSSSAHIVGHDWGGLVAWWFAAQRPALTRTLTILNAPHPVIYRRLVWRTTQLLKSAYVPFFMVPALAAGLLSAGNYFLLKQMFLRGAARSGTFTAGDLLRYVEAASRPGALRAGLTYYRANVHLGYDAVSIPRITVPTLVIWGERDPALGTQLLSGLEEVTTDLRVERLPGIGHWVQSEAPDMVTKLVIEHIRRA
jgi:pimeloyl-ACP methyl ester carboxylesterase